MDVLKYLDDTQKIVIGKKTNAININIPEGVEVINVDAFKNSKIENITFPKTLEEIGKTAFSNCNLNNIYIENEVKLGNFAFEGCHELKSIYVNSETISSGCFYNCLGDYMDITLVGTKVIKEQAFKGIRIKNISLPDTLEEINALAFADIFFSNPEL